MESSKAGHWLQIGANVGILISLILVALQINENTRIARADLTARTYEMAMQGMLSQMGENPIAARVAAATKPGEMTDEELLVVDAMVMFWWNFDTRVELLAEEGLTVNHAELDAYMAGRPSLVYGTSPIAARTWEDVFSSSPFKYSWESTVNKAMKNSEHDADLKRLKSLRQAANAATIARARQPDAQDR